MATLVDTVIYLGTVEHLRAAMERIIISAGPSRTIVVGDWGFQLNEHRKTKSEPVGPMGEHGRTDVEFPMRASWGVWRLQPGQEDFLPGLAGIEAFQESPVDTRIQFWDGYCVYSPEVEYKPIGQPFLEFCEMIAAELVVDGGECPTPGGELGPQAKPQRGQLPHIMERRQRLLDLYRAGLTAERMAENLSCGESTVYRDLKDLGLSLKRK